MTLKEYFEKYDYAYDNWEPEPERWNPNEELESRISHSVFLAFWKYVRMLDEELALGLLESPTGTDHIAFPLRQFFGWASITCTGITLHSEHFDYIDERGNVKSFDALRADYRISRFGSECVRSVYSSCALAGGEMGLEGKEVDDLLIRLTRKAHTEVGEAEFFTPVHHRFCIGGRWYMLRGEFIKWDVLKKSTAKYESQHLEERFPSADLWDGWDREAEEADAFGYDVDDTFRWGI